MSKILVIGLLIGLGCSSTRLIHEPEFGLYEAVMYQYPSDASENERRFDYPELESKEASAIRRSDFLVFESAEMITSIKKYSDSEVRLSMPCSIEPPILKEGSRIKVNDNTHGLIESITTNGLMTIYWHSKFEDGDKYSFIQTLEFIRRCQ